jgi:thymidylate kinase
MDTRTSPGPFPVKAPRILVDGLDMTGKTTLTHAIVEVLAERGVAAMRHRGMLAHHHPLERWLKKTFPLVRQPESSLVTTAFLLGGYALDGLLAELDPPRPAGTVLVQDGYADRTVAFGMAGGPYLAACLALRWPRVFAAFDVAVYLHAPAEVRAGRLAVRDDADANDIRTVADQAFAEVFSVMLMRGMGRRHKRLLVFDTSRHTPQEMAATIAGILLAARPEGESPYDQQLDAVAGRAA